MRTAVSSPHQTTSPCALGNTVFLYPSSSSPNLTCSLWSAPHHIRQANTLPFNRPTTKSPYTALRTASDKTERRVTEGTTWLDMLQMWRSVLMGSSSALATVEATCVSGTGRRARCITRLRRAMRLCCQYSGTLGRQVRWLLVT